jgi:hypothetical protein
MRDGHKPDDNGDLSTSGPKREEMAGDWRRLHNEELHNLSTSPHIFRVIKSRKMKMRSHLVHKGDMINAHKVFGRKT